MGVPTPNDATLTTPPFCSLRVGVTLPVGVAEVHVTASSVSRDGVRMVRVGRVGGAGGEEEEEEEGGSGRCLECEETFVSCLQVSCFDEVITVIADLCICNVLLP